MPDLGRQILHRGSDDAQNGEEHGVAIARNDLGGVRLHRQTQLFGHVLLDEGIDVGERAHRPGNGAGGDVLARRLKAFRTFRPAGTRRREGGWGS